MINIHTIFFVCSDIFGDILKTSRFNIGVNSLGSPHRMDNINHIITPNGGLNIFLHLVGEFQHIFPLRNLSLRVKGYTDLFNIQTQDLAPFKDPKPVKVESIIRSNDGGFEFIDYLEEFNNTILLGFIIMTFNNPMITFVGLHTDHKDTTVLWFQRGRLQVKYKTGDLVIFRKTFEQPLFPLNKILFHRRQDHNLVLTFFTIRIKSSVTEEFNQTTITIETFNHKGQSFLQSLVVVGFKFFNNDFVFTDSLLLKFFGSIIELQRS